MLLPVHLLYSGFWPRYPLLPLPKCPPLPPQLSSPQIFPLQGPTQIPPLPWSLFTSLCWTGSHKPLYQTQSTLIALSIYPSPDSVHKSEKLRNSRQPSQRCTPALTIWIRETQFHQKPGEIFLGTELEERRYFRYLIICGHREQYGFQIASVYVAGVTTV